MEAMVAWGWREGGGGSVGSWNRGCGRSWSCCCVIETGGVGKGGGVGAGGDFFVGCRSADASVVGLSPSGESRFDAVGDSVAVDAEATCCDCAFGWKKDRMEG